MDQYSRQDVLLLKSIIEERTETSLLMRSYLSKLLVASEMPTFSVRGVLENIHGSYSNFSFKESPVNLMLKCLDVPIEDVPSIFEYDCYESNTLAAWRLKLGK
jgi:hypothetical protein